MTANDARNVLQCLSTLLMFVFSFAATAQEGFEDVHILDPPDGGGITDIFFTPQGKLLLTNKFGKLYWYDDFESNPEQYTMVLDLSDRICINGERGLGSVTAHPRYGIENSYIYVYYTYKKYGNCDNGNIETGPINRLSRYTMLPGEEIDISTERVLIDTASTTDQMHNSGDIWFGKDGMMYISIGDGFGHREEVSQNNSNLFGTIIRITEYGGIPNDNPFADGPRCNEGSAESGNCAEIYVSGLRNPWKFAMDPNANDVRFFINDVSASRWEEINECGPDYAGANYGWPPREGPCVKDSTIDCSTNNNYTDPIHYYLHDENHEGAVTGGAFVPDGIWPSEFTGAYIYSDFVFGKIYSMTPGNNGCRTCTPPRSDMNVQVMAEFDRVVAMMFGPWKDTLGRQSEALYYVGRTPHVVRRLAYVDNANRRPNAVIISSATDGQIGSKIKFDGTNSTDPDGDGLSYAWDFDGDGKVDSTDSNPSYTFDFTGVVAITLTVRDIFGAHDTALTYIEIGTKPTAEILEPSEGTTFAVGDVLTLIGSGSDGDNDSPLPDTSLSWEVRQHHHTHYHPFLDEGTVGNNIQLSPAPNPEDFDAAPNSYLEIVLTVTSSNGLTETVSRNVMPRMVNIEFDSDPTGRELILDSNRIITPSTVPLWEGQVFKAEAPNQLSAAEIFTWKSWSDGGDQTHSIAVLPDKNMSKFVVSFETTPRPPPILLLVGNSKTQQPGDGKTLFPDEPIESNPKGYFLKQHQNGELIFYEGLPETAEFMLWSNGYRGQAQPYYSYLGGDGNFITREGTPESKGPAVWTSNRNSHVGDWFLEFDPLTKEIVIYEGFQDNRGARIWWAATETIAVTSSPSSSPSISVAPSGTPTSAPSSSPSTAPTKSASMAPSELPSAIPTAFIVPSFSPSLSESTTPTSAPTKAEKNTASPSLSESTTPTSAPIKAEKDTAEVISADPLCKLGIRSLDYCCPFGCGKCGGIGCIGRGSIAGECCINQDLLTSRPCSKVGPPCIISKDDESSDSKFEVSAAHEAISTVWYSLPGFLFAMLGLLIN